MDATATYEIYGIEEAFKQPLFIDTNVTVISGADSQTKSYDVDSNAVQLFVKDNNALLNVKLLYSNGSNVTRLPKELRHLNREGNDLTQAPDVYTKADAEFTVNSGAADMFRIPLFVNDERGQLLARVESFEITTVGGTDLTFIVEKIARY
ncbi:hypothetical protein D3C78_1440960 [compost metagenome]